ncbi:MAG: hypothetical protein HC817_01750 [Saprospiraceae bacterium]|nr:hypothetical protein [Saprospiraceae bacterium]
MAHGASKLLGHKANGYTELYRIFGLFNGLLFGFLGLIVLVEILKKENFDPKTINYTLISVALATNLYYFSTFNAYMSHNYSFMLWAAVVHLTQKFYTEGYQNRHLWFMALILGLIAIIRPVDILLILVPLFYGIKKWADLTARFQLMWQKRVPLFGAFMLGIVPVLPQLLYWHHISGAWIIDSYTNQTFDFRKLRIVAGWFSFSNGWLIYTPIMFFALVGLFMSFKKSAFALPILLFLPLFGYVIHAWWCWNYINGFGMRPMVNTYALLAIPLSIFIAKMLRSGFLQVVSTVVLVFFIWLNIFQTWQSVEGIMISETANSAYWRAIFGKKQLDYNALVAFDSNEIQPANLPKNVKLLREIILRIQLPKNMSEHP